MSEIEFDLHEGNIRMTIGRTGGEPLTADELKHIMPKSEWVEQLNVAENEERYEHCVKIKEVISSFES